MKKKSKIILTLMLTILTISSTVIAVICFYYTPVYFEIYPEKHKFFWYATWNDLSHDRLYDSYEEIDMISPVWWHVFENGTIEQDVLQYLDDFELLELMDFCTEKNIEVHPLVSNYIEEFNGNIISVIINNQSKISNFISSASYLLDYYNCSGLNLDFEGVPETDRKAFNAFLQRVRTEIDSRFSISIDVPAKTWDYKIGWGGAFDYEIIGQICDRVMIMTYDYHWSDSSPGEIAPRSWVRSTLKYACEVLPHNKIFCGIPLYGYNWPDTGDSAISAEFSYFANLVETYTIEPSRCRDSQELHITYTDSYGTTWNAYYPDAITTFKKEAEINKFPIGGYCYWYLGLEESIYW
ncbi:MAG: glycosyl hydrolase family 18 protein [Candidatus Thorarchaeota archaeon]